MPRRLHSLAFVASVVASVAPSVAPSVARADVAPVGASACDGKAVGAACETFGVTNGVCAQSTCSKLDYSNGTPPTTKSYSCLRCLPRPAKPPPPKDAGAAPSASDAAASPQPSSDPAPSTSTPPAASSAPPPPAASPSAPPAPPPSATEAAAPTSAPAPEPKKQGGCHAGAVGASGGGWLVAIGALAMVVARRRRATARVASRAPSGL